LFMSGWSGPGRAYVRDQIGRDQMRLLVQLAPARDPDHKETPTLLDLVSAPEDRAIVELQLNRVAIGRPVIGPPGVPADRIAMLRVAFNMAVADPDFLKEAALQRLAIDPMNGNDAEELINRLYRTPAPVIDRLRKIVQVAE
jgi:tripartite-type tricarboxylate transporter receptor subunit TctC